MTSLNRKLDLQERKGSKTKLVPQGTLDDINEVLEEAVAHPVVKVGEKKAKAKMAREEHKKPLNKKLSLKREEKQPVPALMPEDFIPDEIKKDIIIPEPVSALMTEEQEVVPATTTEEQDTISSKVTEDFVPEVKVVEETHVPVPAKTKKLLEVKSSIAPPDYNEEAFHEQKEPEFVYEIPEGYTPSETEPTMESVQDTPDEVEIEEDTEVVRSPQELMMDRLSDQLSSLVKTDPKPVTPEFAAQTILENKILQLERTLYDTRRMMLEMTQGTIVSGMGGHHSGGGEVNLKFLDDVSVNNIQDGDSLVWDSTLAQFIPSSADGSISLDGLGRRMARAESKFISLDERIAKFLAQDTRFLELEQNTTEDGTQQGEPRDFIDEVADGDTTTFVVGVDPERLVYTLDGVPQPTVQVPRGDIIVFDISGLSNPDKFDVFQNGVVLQTGYSRDDTPGSESITITTGSVSTDYTKLYYRHTEINGRGWIIQITDN